MMTFECINLLLMRQKISDAKRIINYYYISESKIPLWSSNTMQTDGDIELLTAVGWYVSVKITSYLSLQRITSKDNLWELQKSVCEWTTKTPRDTFQVYPNRQSPSPQNQIFLLLYSARSKVAKPVEARQRWVRPGPVTMARRHNAYGDIMGMESMYKMYNEA